MPLTIHKLLKTIPYSRLYLFKKWMIAIKEKSLFGKKLETSGFFDPTFYVNQYPDILEAGINPLWHFLLHGVYEKRNPNSWFDTALYLDTYADVRETGINPLIHYYKFGALEKRITQFHSASLETTYAGNSLDECLQDMQYIKSNSLFDADYYKAYYPDTRESTMDLCLHFVLFGWIEGRNPSENFNTRYYIQENKDIDFGEINPLVHYHKFGRNEGRLGKRFLFKESDCVTRAEISDLVVPCEFKSNYSIAVTAHIYYPELMDEIIHYISNIPTPFSIYISTSAENQPYISQKFTDLFGESVKKIEVFKNSGRDILPFINFLQNDLGEYDLVCKIHTKKSPHNVNLRHWRTYLLENLLGSKAVVNKILYEFSQDTKLGLVFPVVYPYLYEIGLAESWGSHTTNKLNYQKAVELFHGISSFDADQPIRFPAGSMFWVRPESLSELKDISLYEYLDVDKDYKTDGTILHSIERAIGLLAETAGFCNKTIYIPKACRYPNKKDVSFLKSISPSLLLISHDFCQAGAQMMLLHFVKWISQNTYWNIRVIALREGHDGGQLKSRFEEYCDPVILEDWNHHATEEQTWLDIKNNLGSIDLIYGNTIVACSTFNWLEDLGIRFITHIHELENSIQLYTNETIRKNMLTYTHHYVACSLAVEQNLIESHNIKKSDITVQYECIEIHKEEIKPTEQIRNQFGLPRNKIIIWGCGTVYWRKGPDWFIQTAKILKERGHLNIQFRWIGDNYWNYEAEQWGKWHLWQDYIVDNDLGDIVIFQGSTDHPSEYFSAGDIYFLSSREDPFPLACLEAAERGLPVVCFNEAGGMHEFTSHGAGVAVPLGDLNAAADALERYVMRPETRIREGNNARERVFSHHSIEQGAPYLLNLCRKAAGKKPLVSIVVPVYNHEKFLAERLNSIYNQSFKDFEVIILDDASLDNSKDIYNQYANKADTQIIYNSENSGSPFRQWKRGLDLAEGTFIWIAEGDDVSDPFFLETLLPLFANESVGLAYCASHSIDQKGMINEEYYLESGHYSHLVWEAEEWRTEYIHTGAEEILNAISIRNTIPNASALLFRRNAIKEIDFTPAFNMITVGDWYVYISILLNNWQIAYSPEHLNYHRRHNQSLVHRQVKSAQSTLADYFMIHSFIVKNITLPEHTFEKMLKSVTNNLMPLWNEIDEDTILEYYNVQKLKELYKLRNKVQTN